MRALVEALHGDVAEPHRLIEHFINEGLRLLDTGNSIAPDVVGLLPRAAPTATVGPEVAGEGAEALAEVAVG